MKIQVKWLNSKCTKNCYPFYLLLLIFLFNNCQENQPISNSTFLKAPFTELDTIATNDWWNRGPNKIIDVKVNRKDVIAFGAYTVSNNILKLSAQLFPLQPEESRTVRLELKENDSWKEIQTQQVNELGWSALFRVENWDNSKSISYRLRHGEEAIYEGLIRRDPIDKEEIVLAALSCNSNKDRGGRPNYVRNINAQDPDLVFFAGDQSYDHKEHTAAWLKFGMQFREVFRNRPMVAIPDDHDIGQGNLWGENGKKAERIQGDDGGYFYHPEYVKDGGKMPNGSLAGPFRFYSNRTRHRSLLYQFNYWWG